MLFTPEQCRKLAQQVEPKNLHCIIAKAEEETTAVPSDLVPHHCTGMKRWHVMQSHAASARYIHYNCENTNNAFFALVCSLMSTIVAQYQRANNNALPQVPLYEFPIPLPVKWNGVPCSWMD
jgi:hypothetical protein